MFDSRDAQPARGTSRLHKEVTGRRPPGLKTVCFTVAMECAYAPYNWTQVDDSNGAVPIKDSNEFANGYDVMMAKKALRKRTAGNSKSSVSTGIR